MKEEVVVDVPNFINDKACIDVHNFSEGLDWQLIADDNENWRTGISSPPQSSIDEIDSLEKHDTPELFMLTRGKVNMVIRDEQGERVMELKPFTPVVVNGWHRTYCPDGPRAGSVLVVENPTSKTEYKNRQEISL